MRRLGTADQQPDKELLDERVRTASGLAEIGPRFDLFGHRRPEATELRGTATPLNAQEHDFEVPAGMLPWRGKPRTAAGAETEVVYWVQRALEQSLKCTIGGNPELSLDGRHRSSTTMR